MRIKGGIVKFSGGLIGIIAAFPGSRKARDSAWGMDLPGGQGRPPHRVDNDGGAGLRARRRHKRGKVGIAHQFLGLIGSLGAENAPYGRLF
jgi:hypothetical protein